jgi:transcriptional regulator with PAS, ATPase and Fis domain
MESFNYLRVPPELLQAVLDNPYEGTIIIDSGGIIRHFSKANEPFYGVATDEVLGRHILDVIPTSGLPNVVRTGRADVGDTFSINGRHVIVNRYPIKIGKRVIGAVGKVIFHDLKALLTLKHKIKKLESTLKKYESEIRETYQARYSFDDLVGVSPKLTQAKEMARKLAVSESPVLLLGESGTGKEIFAHAIHRASLRRGHPFIRVNCTSIPGELFESELFGYEPGAFTGAVKSGKPGKFELAHKGTIFLDEIGELPLGLQAKLLRVLQEKEVEPLGSRRPKMVDFRVITATNRNLAERVREGYFRKDLFYRLNVISILLPPLRDMKEDIPALAQYFLQKLKLRVSAVVSEISPEVLDIFRSYDWPGNIRELQNVIERALSLCGDSMITPEHLPEGLLEDHDRLEVEPSEGLLRGDEPLHLAVSNAEREQLIEALRRTGGNRTQAAALLNIHRTTLYYRLKKFGVRRMDLLGSIT